jgi:GT2 family glycosyltransferase
VNYPSVSVVIVNWNHGHYLPECLNSLLAQEYSSLDITVVDNDSQDGSPDCITHHYPAVHLWRFSKNYGFSRAFNFGVDQTGGEWVLSLNPDTVVRGGFFRALVETLRRDGADEGQLGTVAPKLLRADDPSILDSTGLFVDRRRRTYDRGQGQPDMGQYDSQLPVFGACGACALFRRDMLEDLALDGEYLDEDFFAYYEDADLAWRAQLRGWSATHAPGAVALHARGWGDTLRQKGRAPKDAIGPRLALRNRYLMAAKNDCWHHFLADLPSILAAELPRLVYVSIARPGVLLGLLDLARALPPALRKRRQIQRCRKVDASAIRHWFFESGSIASSW